MNGAKEQAVVRLEGRLGAIAVVDVEIDDGDVRAMPSAWATRAATATLENRQKPMSWSGSAWWPGGRTAAKARAVSPRVMARTASITAPAARRAARTLPGDKTVSASSALRPAAGEAASRRAT